VIYIDLIQQVLHESGLKRAFFSTWSRKLTLKQKNLFQN